MKVSKSLAIFICLSAVVTTTLGQRRRSRPTTTTTTEASPEDAEAAQTIAEREANLYKREEVLREREVNFKERETTLTAREDTFREREQKLAKREDNLSKREQNTVRGKGNCGTVDVSTPAPDLDVVRFDGDSMDYLEIGSVSLCPENMRFFAVPDNETDGRCDCDYHVCTRPLLYSDKYKQCFWAWSQGPCEQKEWYVYDANYEPMCEPNPCDESPAIAISSYYFKNPTDGKCYKAGTKGNCEKRGEKLLTIPGEPIPQCRAQAVCYSQTVPPTQDCILGNRRYFDGLCDV